MCFEDSSSVILSWSRVLIEELDESGLVVNFGIRCSYGSLTFIDFDCDVTYKI